MLDVVTTACFTGHRPNKLGGYDESNPIMTNVKQRLAECIDVAIQNGVTTFISGMALGVDMAAAEIVIDKGVKLIAAVPFRGQERMWPLQSRQRWELILTKASEVVYVCDDGYAAWKMQKRNEWMVDNSSLVIAVWDGTTGGTGNCVKYAQRAKHSPKIETITPIDV